MKLPGWDKVEQGAGDAVGYSPAGKWGQDLLDTLTGKGAADAAREAAAIQLEGTKLGIEEMKAGREQAFQALSPFREAGQGQLAGLSSLISDPNAQKNFIQNNPFFNSLADSATSRLFANQAARGKVGSGGTKEGLQTSLLNLGNQLLNQNITQRMNLATMGSNAAAGQATATQNASGGIADLIGQGANAQAAGVVGAANARTQALNNLFQMGTNGALIYTLSDRRYKKDIKKVGKLDNGLNVYTFKYKGDDNIHMNVMAQEVEKKIPGAVLDTGIAKFVNMEKIHAN